MLNEPRWQIRIALWLFTVLALIRIVAGDFANSQAYDEPAHVAPGVEWMERGTYLIDALHPPLARIAIGLPLYVVGVRFSQIPPKANATPESLFAIGNDLLAGDGHYLRNLVVARCGMLPFFLAGIVLIFWWARKEWGPLAAVLAAVIFTTLPVILTFAGLAYTDLPAAITQLGIILAFAVWLDRGSAGTTVTLGLVACLACLSKFTTLLFFPAAACGILFLWLIAGRRGSQFSGDVLRWAGHALVATMICALVVWAGYRFSYRPVIEGLELSRQSLPTFQHLPVPARQLARAVVARDLRVPAPELAMGIAESNVKTQAPSPTYVLGSVHPTGTWYFFPLGLFFKNPIPFVALALVGVFASSRAGPTWTARVPAVAATFVLIASMFVRYDAGQRHVLVLYPLLAILAGIGGAYLWESRKKWQRTLLLVLLVWLGNESARAGLGPMGYFNEFALPDPSRILVSGCDLDCGQDAYRLANQLRERHVASVHLALWTSVDLRQIGLPRYDLLEAGKPVTGWVAIGMRSLRLGDVGHESHSVDAFSWLEAYKPVAYAGTTIRIYCIPDQTRGVSNVCPTH